MNSIKLLAILLIVGGLIALLYGGFTYTKDSHDLRIGNAEMSIKEKGRFNVPVWAGVGAVAAGAVLLIVRPQTT